MKIFRAISFLWLATGLWMPLASAQQAGSPLVRYFSVEQYQAHGQNFSLTQDARGTILAANFAGVLEYDGWQWRMIPTADNRQVNDLAELADSGQIFVAARGELGRLLPDALGRMTFRPLVPDSMFRFADQTFHRALVADNGWAYFASDSAVFQWDGQSLTRIIEPVDLVVSTFVFGDRLYIFRKESGAQFYGPGQPLASLGMAEDIPKQIEVVSMVENPDGGYWLITRRLGILALRDGRIVKGLEASASLGSITCGTLLPNGQFALGTDGMGLVIADKEGHPVMVIDKSDGLENESVNDIFVDMHHNIWLALNDGLALVEYPSPIGVLDDEDGISGEAREVVRHNGTVYLASSQGIQYMDASGQFAKVADAESQAEIIYGCFGFAQAGPDLLAATSRGVYRVEQGEAALLVELFATSIIASPGSADTLYVGTTSGLAVLAREGDGWRLAREVQAGVSVTKLLAVKGKGIWMESLRQGLVRVDPSNWEYKRYSSDTIIGYEMNLLEDNVVFSSEQNFYVYDPAQDRFVESYPFGRQNFWFDLFKRDASGRYWATQGSQRDIAILERLGEDSAKVLREPFMSVSDFVVSSIYFDGGRTWLAGPKGLVVFDSEQMAERAIEFGAMIRRVSTVGDSLLFAGTFLRAEGGIAPGQAEGAAPRLSHHFNSIRFEFAAPRFHARGQLLFSYLLEGFDESWSPFGAINTKEYTNLPAGVYVFRVKARDREGNISQEATFRFEVLRPWFYKWWAFVFYLSILGLAIWFAFKLRSRQLLKEKMALEKTIEERTEEVVRQKEEMEKQSLELAKKNEELGKINRIVKTINSQIKLEGLFDALLTMLKMIKGTEKAGALVLNQETGNFTYKATFGVDKELVQNHELTFEEAEDLFLRGSMEVFEDIFFKNEIEDRALNPLGLSPPPKSILVIVVNIESKVQGFIILANLKHHDAFDSSDFSMTNNLKQHLISAFIKTRILEDLQVTLLNLRETQEELVRQEQLASAGKLTQGLVDRVINPLNYIVNFSDVTLELKDEVSEMLTEEAPDLDEELKAELEDVLGMMHSNVSKILSHGRVATRIIKEMEDVIRPKSQEFAALDLAQFSREYVPRLFTEIAGSDKSLPNPQVQFEFKEASLPVRIVPAEFIKMLRHMCHNSAISMRNRRQKAGASYQPLFRVVGRVEQDHVRLDLVDNGVGIPEQDIRKVFDPLFTTRPPAEATGLGLYYCMDVVKMHKGRLEVSSEVDKFANFSLRLPLVQA